MANEIFKKYEMAYKEAADALIDALPSATDEEGNTYPTHRHSVVRLDYIVKVPAEMDEEGNVITEAVRSDKYSVDVLWNKEQLTSVVQEAVYDEEGNLTQEQITEFAFPEGWEECEVQYDEETWGNPNGAHSFLGWNFN